MKIVCEKYNHIKKDSNGNWSAANFFVNDDGKFITQSILINKDSSVRDKMLCLAYGCSAFYVLCDKAGLKGDDVDIKEHGNLNDPNSVGGNLMKFAYENFDKIIEKCYNDFNIPNILSAMNNVGFCLDFNNDIPTINWYKMRVNTRELKSL